ncbi:MAG: Gx transporter family protein [Oscillospiraceae bacterium]|nr:Gx transporter family protein [Oscillospiraceae bacterium]
MPKTRKLTLMALLTAIALTIFVIENQIPAPVPIPGVKLGLANIITLIAMKLLGKKEAGAVLLVRILMGAMFAGSPSTLLFSAAGGLLAYLVMCLTVDLFGENQLWIVSALAGLAHNAGQLLACVLVVRTPCVFAYAPVLAASGVITGVFTGLAAQALLKALKKTKFW